MGKMQYEWMLSIQKARFDERLRRRPFLKIMEGTENYPVPLCYDPRPEEEVLRHINLRMKRKMQKNRFVDDFDGRVYVGSRRSIYGRSVYGF